jgi:cytochrome c peroxidase
MKTQARFKLYAGLLSTVVVTGQVDAGFDEAALPNPARNGAFHDRGSPDEKKVELGKLLFFDKILSGNRTISCATCHHPFAGTGDGLSLPVGEGGNGLGVSRNTGSGNQVVPERVPRNSPPLFNLGAKQFKAMFHDGRVRVDATQPSGFLNPAGDDLPQGLDSVLAAQAMFPVTSATEMAGQPGENPIADAAAAGLLAGPHGVWAKLARRLKRVREYVSLFKQAYDHIDHRRDISFVDAANAIAAFEASAWRADNSPFDRYLRGDKRAMSPNAVVGMRLFYGKAGCGGCHGGPFLTDHSFRAIAMPQIGPGKGDGPSGHEDFGLERVTGIPADRYKFRVPTLKNVALTGPYGHSGAYNSLEAVVRHHLNPVDALETYDTSRAALPRRPDLDAVDYIAQSDSQVRHNIAAANELAPIALSDRQVARLLDFLHALTDPDSIDLRRDVPWSVPSGLPVFD